MGNSNRAYRACRCGHKHCDSAVEVKHEHKNEKFDQLKFGDNYDVE